MGAFYAFKAEAAHMRLALVMYKVLLKGQFTNISIHPGWCKVIRNWQNCKVYVPGMAEVACDLAEGLAGAQAAATLEMGG